MHHLESYRRSATICVAIVLFAGVGLAITWFAGRSRPPSTSPQPVRAGDQHEATSIAAELVTAIRNADAPAVRKLLEGTDVNARDDEGNTPLILASLYASPECVELLINKGADVNVAN